jgi:uncharacterized protein with HEPN domain
MKPTAIVWLRCSGTARPQYGFLEQPMPGVLQLMKGHFFAISYALQTLGEAANRVSTATRSKLDDIAWVRVIGMRHHLVHGYEDIRKEIVVKTVRDDLPTLLTSLRRALDESGR